MTEASYAYEKPGDVYIPIASRAQLSMISDKNNTLSFGLNSSDRNTASFTKNTKSPTER
jgi:hypothetical protein